jgi:hypothetical protein
MRNVADHLTISEGLGTVPSGMAPLGELGGVALPASPADSGSPADFGGLLGNETEKWLRGVATDGAYRVLLSVSR